MQGCVSNNNDKLTLWALRDARKTESSRYDGLLPLSRSSVLCVCV